MFVWRSEVDLHIFLFFVYWPLACAFTGVTLMGLYFKEISSLTSVQTSSGFRLLLVPSIVVLSGAWFMVLLAGGFGTNPTLNAFNASPQKAVFALIVVILSVSFVIVIWGAIELIFASRGNQNGAVTRVIVLSVIAACINVAFGIAFALNFTFIGDYFVNISILSIIAFYEMLMIFVPCCVTILVMINFQVSVAKEIELSKSGTSSTSSSTNKSSSKSSSSTSGADPVIEL